MSPPRIGTDAGPCTILIGGSVLCVIGTLKGVVNVLFASLYAVIPSAVIAVVYTPKVCAHAYATLLLTPRIGPNLKTLGVLTVWVPIVLWPFLVVLLSLVGGICVGFACPLASTFDAQEWLLFGGFTWCYTEITDAVKELFRWESRALDTLCEELLQPLPPPPGSESVVSEPAVPFDISLILLVWCLLIGFVCGLIGGITCTLIFIVMWLPCTLRLYVEMWTSYWDGGCSCWHVVLLLPFLVANVLLLPLTLLGVVVLIIAGFIYLCKGGVECYESGAIKAFQDMEETVLECWSMATSFAFKGRMG